MLGNFPARRQEAYGEGPHPSGGGHSRPSVRGHGADLGGSTGGRRCLRGRRRLRSGRRNRLRQLRNSACARRPRQPDCHGIVLRIGRRRTASPGQLHFRSGDCDHSEFQFRDGWPAHCHREKRAFLDSEVGLRWIDRYAARAGSDPPGTALARGYCFRPLLRSCQRRPRQDVIRVRRAPEAGTFRRSLPCQPDSAGE